MDILKQKYDVLLDSLRASMPEDELKTLDLAYKFARNAHQGQLRKSGEPFFIHPIEVTQILADLGMGVDTLSAALLHDTVEDTEATIEDIETKFGKVTAHLVDGVTKLTMLQYGENANAETIRKMIIAMSKDIRVLIIKLADRLHNARTWKYVSVESAQRKAKETLDIYAPLAHRLGLNHIKRELEDLSFATLYPKVYAEIKVMVSEYAPAAQEYTDGAVKVINGLLDETRVKAVVVGRPKHYYSVYQKMIVKGRDFKDIYDLVGIRIITDTILDCYAALGAVHAKWNHLPGRFKDYIAMPKYNMYQSIHTTVIGPEGKIIEIQIRTTEMHQFAQYGVAAHWRYKQGDDDKIRSSRLTDEEFAQTEDNLKWVKQLVDWQGETEDSTEFLESLRFDLTSDQVYVISPKGLVVTLPSEATPVDFAYAIHTEIGHRTMGARINGKLVPLNSVLNNGDTVEILTTKSDGAGPSRDWLGFVKSQRTRNKIRLWFSKSRKEEDIERGKEELAKAIKGKNLPFRRLLTHEILLQVAQEMHQKSVDDIYHGIGRRSFSAQTIINHILSIQHDDMQDEMVDEKTVDITNIHDAVQASQSVANKSTNAINPGISVSGVESENDVWIKLAKCCTPAPGDEIVGYVTKGQGISIHRKDCYNLHVLQSEQDPSRFVESHWQQGANTTFLANVQVEGIDRSALLADITRVLSDSHVNILQAQVDTSEDRIAKQRWTFEVGDAAHLARIMSLIRKVDGVYDVYRLTGKRA